MEVKIIKTSTRD